MFIDSETETNWLFLSRTTVCRYALYSCSSEYPNGDVVIICDGYSNWVVVVLASTGWIKPISEIITELDNVND